MNAQQFTVLGAHGLIGKALSQWLIDSGHEVYAPSRSLSPAELCSSLRGHVVYCIGLTADFRRRPWDTVDAHVVLLRQILEFADFVSFTYLSSSRVYKGGNSSIEQDPLKVQPELPDQLYNISKLMGEAICHTANLPEKPVRVVRLSNVIGGDIRSDNFIIALLREAVQTGTINLNSHIHTAKDYIALTDVIHMLEKIAIHGKESCYNLGSGELISNSNIIDNIVKLTEAKLIIKPYLPLINFPALDIRKLKNEFDFTPIPPMEELHRFLSTLLKSSN